MSTLLPSVGRWCEIGLFKPTYGPKANKILALFFGLVCAWLGQNLVSRQVKTRFGIALALGLRNLNKPSQKNALELGSEYHPALLDTAHESHGDGRANSIRTSPALPYVMLE